MVYKNLLLAMIPIFVAVDAIGVLPIYIAFTQDLTESEKKKIVIQSVITALCVGFGFIFLGKNIFRFLGITVGDFMIAGGAILFCIAIIDILNAVNSAVFLQKTWERFHWALRSLLALLFLLLHWL